MELSILKQLDDQYILNTYKRYPLQVVSGEGVYVFDENNNKYLDFLSGIAVNALGYGHKKILDVINTQSERLIHISNLFYTETPVNLAKKLCDISGMNKVFFCNSGAEANELSIKLAHLSGKKFSNRKNKIICMNNSFHGRTIASLSVTKSFDYGDKFSPLVEGALFVDLNDVSALSQVFDEEVCGIIIEPIQGEGGLNIADNDYLSLARDLANKYNALLIFDEVQSGLGRTGKYFAYQHSEVEPDIITLAKPIAVGLPMGAVLIKNDLASLLTYGDHGSTFGGNSLISAVALKFLEILEEEKLLDNAICQGDYFKEELLKLKNKYKLIKDVRGKGLMLGLELKEPASEVVLNLMQEGLICNCTANNVIRFLPPYIVTSYHIDQAISIIEKVLNESIL